VPPSYSVLTLDRFQLANLATARRTLASPDNFSAFEVEQASALVSRLEGQADRIPDLCRWCDRAVSSHSIGVDPRSLGASLCPVVRDYGRKGSPARGEKTEWTYYSAPTPEQARAWREARDAATVKPATVAERKADAKARQGSL
jgi:hypothetical protein